MSHLNSDDRWLKKKESFLRSNVDLNNLQGKKSSKKKSSSATVVIERLSRFTFSMISLCEVLSFNDLFSSLEPSFDSKSLVHDMNLLKKRVSKLEKVYGIIRKNTSFDQTVMIRGTIVRKTTGDL